MTHIFGKGEVECSIHSVGTTNPLENKYFLYWARFRYLQERAERRGNKPLFAQTSGAKSVHSVLEVFHETHNSFDDWPSDCSAGDFYAGVSNRKGPALLSE